jgi:AraC family transcriptional regulator of adaptative response/methylated-DNA-[protein]-cysteine methyltransferase
MHATAPVTFEIHPCSLGHALIASSTAGVCAILLGDSPDALLHELHAAKPRLSTDASSRTSLELFEPALEVVEGLREPATLKLDIEGTVFCQQVWAALRDIPVGETRSYRDIAHAIGKPAAVRAVAKACASNTLAVAIPCHRVIRSNGDLSGYRWGIARKEQLLLREMRSN